MNQQNTVPEIPSIMPPPPPQSSGGMHQQNTLQEILHLHSTNSALVNQLQLPYNLS